MILNDAVISALSEAIQADEASISSHWQSELKGFRHDQGEFFGVRVDGHTPKTGIMMRLRQFALLAPFWRMGYKFPKFKEFYRAGKDIAQRRGGMVDLGMVRQVLSLSLLDQYLSTDQARLPTVIIGDGWGTMASLFLSRKPQTKIVLVNLTSMLLVDLVYIKKSFPDIGICLARNVEEYQSGLESDEVRVVAVCADDMEIIGHGPIGTAINIVSMQEMDPWAIAAYFDAFRRSPNTTTLFYCCNRVEKTLPDGTKIRFDEYPWEPEDNVLVDEDCGWHQFYLRFRPPFIGRYDGPVWHRLAVLNKNQNSDG